jgi:hypothetical protein
VFLVSAVEAGTFILEEQGPYNHRTKKLSDIDSSKSFYKISLISNTFEILSEHAIICIIE